MSRSVFFNLLLLCKQNLRSHSHLKPPASSLRTLHALKLYSGSTRRESWLVNSHTPLYSNNGIWLVKTVVHLSAVLQPYWSTEEGWGGGVYSFYTSQASLRLRTQNVILNMTERYGDRLPFWIVVCQIFGRKWTVCTSVSLIWRCGIVETMWHIYLENWGFICDITR